MSFSFPEKGGVGHFSGRRKRPFMQQKPAETIFK
jgi:hypothetical protein